MKRASERCLQWSSLGLLVALVGACRQPPPREPSTVLAASSPSQKEVLQIVSSEEADPRTVRCGVDDRPKSVISAWDDGGFGSSSRAKRAPTEEFAPQTSAARRAPGPVGPQGGWARPRPRPRPIHVPVPPLPFVPPIEDFPDSAADRAFPFEPPPPDVPQLFIDPEPLRERTGARLSPEIANASATLRPELAGCGSLAAGSEERPFSMVLRLGTAGETLSATPMASGSPTPYERCLMETACRLHTLPLPTSVAVELAIRTHRELPRAVPSAAPVVALVTMETDPRAERGLARAVFQQAADRCGHLGALGQAVRVTARGGPSRRVEEVRTSDPDGQSPVASPAVVCVVRQIGNLLEGRLASPKVVGVIRWRAP